MHVDINAYIFIDVVSVKDRKSINPWTQGVIYHFLVYHEEIEASKSALRNTSEYTNRFYKNVLSDIKSRDIDVYFIDLPNQYNDVHFDTKYATLVNEKLKKWDILYTKEEIEEDVSTPEKLREKLLLLHHSANKSYTDFHKLPRSFKKRENFRLVTLPDFSVNYTEFAFSSMIERESNSYKLYLTTFFLCHSLMKSSSDIEESAKGNNIVSLVSTTYESR